MLKAMYVYLPESQALISRSAARAMTSLRQELRRRMTTVHGAFMEDMPNLIEFLRFNNEYVVILPP